MGEGIDSVADDDNLLSKEADLFASIEEYLCSLHRLEPKEADLSFDQVCVFVPVMSPLPLPSDVSHGLSVSVQLQ